METNNRITVILAHLKGGVAGIYVQRKLDKLDKETRIQDWKEFVQEIKTTLSQTSFSLYLHNQWTDFHKLSCAGKPQTRAIHTYVGCIKATTND